MGFGKLKVGNENSTIGLNNINLQFNFNVEADHLGVVVD